MITNQKSSRLLNKFSLSACYEMCIEQYGNMHTDVRMQRANQALYQKIAYKDATLSEARATTMKRQNLFNR